MRLTPEQVVGMALRDAGLDNIGMKVPAVAEAIFDALDQNGYEITNKPRHVPGKPVSVGKRTNPLKTAQHLADRRVSLMQDPGTQHVQIVGRGVRVTPEIDEDDDNNGGYF